MPPTAAREGRSPLFSRISTFEDRKVVLKAREAAEYLRLSLFTPNKMERQSLLTPFRTPGGHRRYTLEMLNQLLEENREGQWMTRTDDGEKESLRLRETVA